MTTIWVYIGAIEKLRRFCQILYERELILNFFTIHLFILLMRLMSMVKKNGLQILSMSLKELFLEKDRQLTVGDLNVGSKKMV